MDIFYIKYKKLIERLQQFSIIDIIEFTPLTEKEYEYTSEAYFNLKRDENYDIDESFKNILSLPPNLKLYFQSNSLAGEFNFYHLSSALESLKDYRLYNASMHTEQQIEQLKHFSIIDDHPFSGDFKLAAFHKDPKTSPPIVPDIYFYNRGDYYKMELDIFQYVDAMLDLAGMTNWQYLFCTTDLPQWELDHIFQNLKKGLDTLKIFFPEKDFSSYEALVNKK